MLADVTAAQKAIGGFWASSANSRHATNLAASCLRWRETRIKCRFSAFHPLQQNCPGKPARSARSDAFVCIPVRPLMCQHRPDYSGKLVGHRHDYDIHRASLFQLLYPGTELFHAIDYGFARRERAKSWGRCRLADMTPGVNRDRF